MQEACGEVHFPQGRAAASASRGGHDVTGYAETESEDKMESPKQLCMSVSLAAF